MIIRHVQRRGTDCGTGRNPKLSPGRQARAILPTLFLLLKAGAVLGFAAVSYGSGAFAQSDGMAAIRRAQLYHLQTRALGGQDVGRDAQELQRQLRLDSPGGTLDGQQRSIDREAERLQKPLFPSASPTAGDARSAADPAQRAATTAPLSVPSTTRGLPEDPASRLGGNDPVTTASSLMSRAERALQSGRPNQARSDLAMADHFLVGLRAADQSIGAGRVKVARDRLSTLQAKLPPR
ncbi:hypothetical protein SAMN07250955_11478 [Arboricoccus pini]|uniref:Uncharacterized protein n=1 Tax=Arboricoccus pini TaxID=1963835 RepID=A0A212RU96_9PROT|nr:hypothetical protein [Arboricoccus pini]SNB76131.1 hypothetical protein SAMN07250955_11478 [Arboricoccus pini]